MSILKSANMDFMQKSLDALWMKQKTIDQNIANFDTPGYKSQHVAFNSMLKKELERPRSSNYAGTTRTLARVVTNKNTSERLDGNNVNMEKENIEMARTVLQYNQMVQKISGSLSTLKYVITEGR
ncbi:MAG: flagellar basal body rod protein FlgB [Oscillospiraceae bacterium]